MIYYATSLAWAAFFLLFISVYSGERVDSANTKISKKGILLLLAILLVAHSSLVSPYWFGIEYEDAFEYIYSAHILTNNDSSVDFQLNPICIYGNISECTKYASLAHPIGLSTLLSFLIYLFGDSSIYGQYISVFFTIVSCLIVHRTLLLLDVSSNISIIAIAGYLSSVGVIVFSNTSLAEPVAACLAISSLWGVIISVKMVKVHSHPSLRKWIVVAFTAISIILSVTVKRESAVIIPGLVLGFVLLSVFSGKSLLNIHGYINALISILIASMLIFLIYFDSLIDMAAVSPTEESTFSFAYIATWGYHYLMVLFSSKYILVSATALIGVFYIDKHPIALFAFVISLSYIFLFVSFSQSYYAVMYGEIPTFHFERYTIQILPFLTVLSGIGVNQIVNAVRLSPRNPFARNSLFFVWMLMIVSSLYFGLGERDAYAEEENLVRKWPIMDACAELEDGDTVITDEIILFELFCKKPLIYISVNVLGNGLSSEVLSVNHPREIYFWIDVSSLNKYRERYPKAFDTITSKYPEILTRESVESNHRLIEVK